MAKVNPEQLEKEADEALAKMMATEEPPEVEAEEVAPQEAEAEDTEETESEDLQDSPSESEDTEVEVEAAEDETEAVGETVESSEEPVEAEASAEQTTEKTDKDGQSVDAVSLAEERMKNAQARMTKATQEAADTKRENTSLRQQLQELKDTMTKAKQAQSNAVLEDLKKEYPDIANPLIDKINALEEQISRSTTDLKEDSMVREQEVHVQKIKEKHPDVDVIHDSEDFQGWLERQTAVWKRVAKEGTSDEVVELLDSYKKEMGMIEEPSETKKEKVARAKAKAEPKLPKARQSQLKGVNKRIWTRKEIGEMSMADFEKNEADIDKAYRDGRIQ